MKNEEPILIVGGGIGGVVTALALMRKGIKSIVLEQATEFREIGGGIQFCPNVFKMLDYLGILPEILEIGYYPDHLVYMDGVSGEEYSRLKIKDAVEKRFHYPYAVFYRAELLNALLRICKKSSLIRLVPSARIVDIAEKEDYIEAISEQGDRYRGKLLIGADGLWSNIRKFVVGENIPRVTKSCVWRGLVPMSQLSPELCPHDVVHWHFPAAHIVHYPISPTGLFNIVVEVESNQELHPLATKGDDTEIDRVLGDGPKRVQDLLKYVDRKMMRVLSDLAPNPTWFKGKMVLLGDSAHATLPHLTQGAGMAIEDAVVLGEKIHKHPEDYRLAFQEYRNERYERTTYVQTLSRAYVEVHHAQGPFRELRNLVFAGCSNDTLFNILSFLYTGINVA